jgi:hypothetical protein
MVEPLHVDCRLRLREEASMYSPSRSGRKEASRVCMLGQSVKLSS